MFNCVRPPEQQQQQQLSPQQQLEPDVASVGANSIAATGAPPPSSRCRPAKVRVRLRLLELEGVTLSHGILFAKVRLLRGGRFCQHSEHREIRDNKVSWSDPPHGVCLPAGPATACRPAAAPAVHLRVSVRREERGGRSYTKIGYAVIDLTDLAWVGDTEHKCILSPYSQGQRLDNSTLRLSLQPLLPSATSTAADGSVASAVAASTPDSAAPVLTSASASSAALGTLGGGGLGHRRNASNFSACSVRTHSRTNSLEQEAVITSNSSQSSSVPSFDLALSSSLERRRAALTPARELSSRIANTRTDNFQIVKEVLEREGILVGAELADS
uniref:C2 NT-type domain-containing protein n=1 Tax=Macrostomum lignano TaxID=282301 RepID=A0A1I8I2P4_9PLAT